MGLCPQADANGDQKLGDIKELNERIHTRDAPSDKYRIILPRILHEDERDENSKATREQNRAVRHGLVQGIIKKINEVMAEHNGAIEEESKKIYLNVEFGSGPTRPKARFYERWWKGTKRGVNAAWRWSRRWTKNPTSTPDRKYLGDTEIQIYYIKDGKLKVYTRGSIHLQKFEWPVNAPG